MHAKVGKREILNCQYSNNDYFILLIKSITVLFLLFCRKNNTKPLSEILILPVILTNVITGILSRVKVFNVVLDLTKEKTLSCNVLKK